MDTFSFVLRAGLWAFAGIQLGKVLVLGGDGEDFALCFLTVVFAWLYSRFSDELFGELMRWGEAEPPAIVEEVDPAMSSVYVSPDARYHADTPSAVVRLLEEARKHRTRLRLHFGDPETGVAERAVEGVVNLSTGVVQLPLVAPPGRPGGVPIADHEIVCLEDLEKHLILYEHPHFVPLAEGISADA